MENFQNIFTLPASLTPDYNVRENVLNQIRQMEDVDRRDAHVQQFINQFQVVDEQECAVGGQIPVPPVLLVNPPVNPPSNVPIVNECNSFNLTNITPLVAPKWKQPDKFLDEFQKFRHSCQRILMDLCAISLVAR